jgi:hypothetical protein
VAIPDRRPSQDLAASTVQVLDDETTVVVRHKNLKADPKDNAGLILAYHNKGLYARLGRVWVCWGDLRTECIKVEDLRANLQTNKG